MTGEIIEGTASESPVVIVAELGVATRDHGHGGVAILLTVAAVVAAAIGFLAAMTASSANSSWQSALRTEVKRSTAAMEDVHYLYQSELPVSVRIIQARLVQSELLAAAQSQSGPTRAALLLEASIQAQVVSNLSQTSGLGTNPKYAMPSGGLDLAKALADLRAEHPELLALDPDALQATGDRLSHKAQLTTVALLPTSGAAFLGVLAQPFRRRRTFLLRLGGLTLAVGALMTLVVQVLA